MKYPLHVVTNIDRSQVTWANAFCNAMQNAGAQIVNPGEIPCHASALYIGDSIDWESVDDGEVAAYFLAAADGTELEKDNVSRAAFTTTPSQSEKERMHRLLNGTAVFADGFPIDFGELDAVKAQQPGPRPFTVGFIGRTEADKGPKCELAIADILARQRIKAVHLSSTANAISGELAAQGVDVAQNLQRSEYVGRLAALKCVINTSPRESLFVSGLEATRIGIPVIAPRVAETGIDDWNRPDWFYDPDKPESIVDILSNIAMGDNETPDVSFYESYRYLERINVHFEEFKGNRT